MNDGDPEKLFEVGEKTIMKCYDRQFNDFLCNVYVKKDLRSRNSVVNLASLLPTKDSATQHISMIFQQIQKWMGLNLRPELHN